ncbi:MAG: tRNA (N(6)-L-threonylcarbamoyladenosine(37)-C(2))-methylthiotransferase MtaB [Clostridia bacterium]|nr:tRNA (N(6)-L-threonylcarbamoyladenosine(37)-C(2))-methylthiotransferase MtaB [Clostridia bacterium]
MKIAFYTLGCKVNQYETEVMREAFEQAGHTVASQGESFDVAVINSCTVTAESDRKTRQILNRFRRENENAIIVLTGCMVQAFPEESAGLWGADIVVGNRDVRKILKLCEEFFDKKQRTVEICPHIRGDKFNTPSVSSFAERTRAYMKIEDGCDRYCSYCIIPTARGWVRSKPLAEIKSEAAQLAKNGYIEVVLVGINLSAYGKGEDINLCDAVDAVASVDGIKRVRLGSLEPDHITDEMLERFKNEPKFCPQFHLSLQSGSNATLKRMNRHYTAEFYYDLINRIRNIFSNAAITTDIMVGFAGETEEEFSESLAFCEKVGFAKAHIFAYSKRKGTVAYGLPNQVTNAEKSARSKRLSAVCEKTEQEFLTSQIGKEFEVLFETYENGLNFGYTPNYSRVFIKSEKSFEGEIKRVKIINSNKDICEGICI